ncbi:uncharacterized protein ARMOST_18660 [Armillaria ostoyae]|uniref:Uncharacterized protein n=1 Tax=Armillaria ostoyae TaxID=47428 RepID=A0A284S2H1_ARMOS|nr:uncharacterized protein ARMOST_18660 [Armillaria ostoyae]
MAAFLRMKSGFLCSDRGKHILHSVFRALFLTLKERSNEMLQHFEALFFRSENVSAPAVNANLTSTAFSQPLTWYYFHLSR